jgi:hypothetical protein
MKDVVTPAVAGVMELFTFYILDFGFNGRLNSSTLSSSQFQSAIQIPKSKI